MEMRKMEKKEMSVFFCAHTCMFWKVMATFACCYLIKGIMNISYSGYIVLFSKLCNCKHYFQGEVGEAKLKCASLEKENKTLGEETKKLKNDIAAQKVYVYI